MKKILYIISSISLIAFVGLLVFQNKANANPLFFPLQSKTATATTTVSYLNAGTGTTTLTVDAYQTGNPTGNLSGTLLVQFAGSSTASILRINQEYADDTTGINCVTSASLCDWYQNTTSVVDNFATSSATAYDIGLVPQYSFQFASTTAGLGIVTSTTGATSTRAIGVKTPTRYTRFILTLPVGSASGAVWASFVPIKERAQ